ncbi:MAG: sulfotransferase family protein [Aquaticitalea sp.]
MNLKIIGAGFGRTGTLSTKTALEMLGYPCYHMFEVIENKANKTHLDFWNEVANAPSGKHHEWKKVFENYTATMDNPASCVWRELLDAYPDAKVILTLHPRGPEAWYESTMDTIYFTESMWQFKFLKLFTPFAKKMGNMTSKLIWQRFHKGTMKNKEAAIARYLDHVEVVKAVVPSEKLLIFTADQGWEPICNFLEAEVPNSKFPNVNDRSEIKKTIANITKGAYVFLAIGVVVLIGIIYGLTKMIA